jgi:leucyl-tRNA synthetase
LEPELIDEKLKGRNLFLVAGTLRPETMYGQTNCFVHPAHEYGIYEMKNDELFVCSERSAWNMAYQGLTKTP